MIEGSIGIKPSVFLLNDSDLPVLREVFFVINAGPFTIGAEERWP
jgi:hypothetical protein